MLGKLPVSYNLRINFRVLLQASPFFFFKILLMKAFLEIFLVISFVLRSLSAIIVL